MIKNRMAEGQNVLEEKLYREERAYRADRLIEKWARVPELGDNLKNLEEKTGRNLAIFLENQARSLSKMTETQLSSSFQGFTPENMLRLVRLAYPNTIRGKLFTEFAMESARDSIKYIRPVYTNSQTGADLSNEKSFDDLNLDGSPNFGDADYRKAMYESTEDRYSSELSNGVVAGLGIGDGDGTLTFADGAFGALGASYIDGYAQLFWGNETQPLAVQMRSGDWFFGGVVEEDATHFYKISAITATGTGTFNFTIVESADGVTGWAAPAADETASLVAFGRADLEGDFTGEHLGEVELVMTDYEFKPRPQTLGVSWPQLMEIVLDTSFGVSAEELLLDAAGQEIKKALDFRAVKLAYAHARALPDAYKVEFDAEAGAGTDDSYLHTAQTFSQAIERIGDVQYNEIMRGGVSRIVGGPAAVSYLRLNSGFTTKGAQERIGGYQVGEIYGTPVFKVPSSIVPDNELMTVWKNDSNEADVAVAFGTLVPFFSTGTIQRKNFYKEAGLASYGDHQVLQPKYLGRIVVNNIRGI